MDALSRPRPRVALGLSVGLVAIAALVTLGGILSNAAVWDDHDLILRNPHVQSFGGLARILSTDIFSATASLEASPYYRPLPMASYVVNALVGGNTPASYHVGNLALHILNAALLMVLALRSGATKRWTAALAAGLLFAVAPVNVEPVAWIAGRFDLLGTTCALGALVVNASTDARRRVAGVGLLAAMALLCKESFVVLPALVALHDVLALRRPLRGELGKYVACAAALAAWFAARALVGAATGSVVASVGLGGMLQGYAFVIATLARALVFPAYLDPYRTYAPPSLPIEAALIAAAALPAAFLAALALRRFRGRPRVGIVAFGAAWVVLACVPVSLAGPTTAIFGERYGYFALVGVFLALAALVDVACEAPRPVRFGAAVLVAGTVVTSAWRSHRRVPDWATDRSLAEASVRDDPENPFALAVLGEADALDGRYAEALPLLRRSLAAAESWRAWNTVCFVQLRVGHPDVAERACARSVEIHGGNPVGWINLASALVNQGRWAEGLVAATRAVELRPRSAEARYLHAACLANTGALAQARAETEAALTLDPGHAGARHLLAQLEARLDGRDE